jgi:hypothetical protein
LKLVAALIPRSITLVFCCWRVSEGERIQKLLAHIRRKESKYWAVHYKNHCRISAGLHKKWRVNAYITEHSGYFTLNITLFFVFWYQCNLFFDKYNMSLMSCTSFWLPCNLHCNSIIIWMFQACIIMSGQCVTYSTKMHWSL